MSSWISRNSYSHNSQLAATAVASGALAASLVLGYQAARRKYKVESLKAHIPEPGQDHPTTRLTEYGAASDHVFAPSKEDERGIALAIRARSGDYDDDLILEQLARNRVFLTDEGLAKLRNAFVIVVGCGGVGSHAVATLTRSGVSKLRLIDFDQVTLSSLNRHAVATLADVGTPKVHAIRKRLEQVCPWTHFDCRNELFNETVAERQLAPDASGQKPDFVIDAIDNIDSKVALLAHCHRNGIPVVSSMGAGCKSDPTRVFVGDISASTEDPLSRSTRRRLRALGIKDGIPVVFSGEKTAPGKAQLLPLPEDEYKKGSVGELGVLPDFRVRILPVLGTMPAIFGLSVANHAILEITGYPHEYLQSKSRDKLYDGVLAALQGAEERLARHRGFDAVGLRIPVTQDDVGYLIEEAWHGKSVVTGLSTRLALVRWRAPEAESFVDRRFEGQKSTLLKLTDLVLMTKEEAQKHEREVLKGGKRPEDLYDPEVLRLVEDRLKEEQVFQRFR
ncbi:putative ubiquitin-protein ligase molybdopterin-converting factor [Diplodia seriata]|uniref:Putative ubiquitin-protein ligase molybdopterin-converting factor n=1 Tax=Diplodia seriata TaxID=420778 RepID=A0A0G2H3M5_9PEZI|nr:putative ubiquitin-protein ligase molybdopterin-converting factor [Diplodia seriata]